MENNELNTVKPDKGPLIVYLCFLGAWILPIAPLIGLVWAYVQNGTASPMVQSHYRFAIRTFWISLVFSILVTLLTMVTFGVLGILYLALALWVIVRVVKGLIAFNRGEFHPNPATWWI